jgi:macrophage erythroblast attacher
MPTLEVMRERLELLASVESMSSLSGPDFDRWADTRLDRWITDWALRAGKERTARKLAETRGIEVRLKYYLTDA